MRVTLWASSTLATGTFLAVVGSGLAAAPALADAAPDTGVQTSSMKIVKAGDATSADGATTIYTRTVTVDGTAAQTGITVTDTVPAGTTFVGCGGAPCHLDGDTVVWDVPPASPGTTTTVQFTVRSGAVYQASDATPSSSQDGTGQGQASYPVVVQLAPANPPAQAEATPSTNETTTTQAQPVESTPVQVLGIKIVKDAPAAAPQLPFTGGHATTEAGVGAALVLLGGSLVVAAGYRRTRRA